MQDSSVLPFPNRASNAESFTPSKIAPHSSEAEQAVLGGLMLKSDAWLEVADVVSTEDFYHNNHKTIFEAVKTLLEEGHACNIITVKDMMERQGIIELENKHIIEYLDTLIHNTPSIVNVKAYADIVRKKSILRRLINVADKIASSAYDPTNNNENDILDKAEQMIFEIAEHGQKNQKGFIEIKDVLAQALDRIDTMFQQDEAITGVPTGFTDFDELTSGLQPSDMVIVAGRPSMGKCLASDSEILLSDGSITTIEQLYQQKHAHLLTLNDDFKLQLTHASEFIDDGVKPVFKVKTRLGRSIETTLSHPFLTISGWKPLAELKVGDKVAVPRILPVFGQNTWRDCEVKLLAYLIGDGSVTGSQVTFCNSSAAIQNDFTHAVKQFGGLTSKVRSSPQRTTSISVSTDYSIIREIRQHFATRLQKLLTENNIPQRQLAFELDVAPSTVHTWVHGTCLPNSSIITKLGQFFKIEAQFLIPNNVGQTHKNAKNNLSVWLDEHGILGKGAKDKFIPAAVFSLQQKQVALFLNRLFATDGWATVLKSGQAQIGYCSISLKLAQQVQHLLLRFGIIATIKQRQVKYKTERRIAYQLDITDAKSLKCFSEEINIFSKEAAVESVVQAIEAKRYQTNRDLIPVEIWEYLAQAKDELPWSHLAKNAGIQGYSNIHVGKRALSRERLLKLATTLNDEYLINLSCSDIYWDEIIAIEETGQKQVYDLTIPDTHNFVANDICVHNTSFAMNVAEYVAIKVQNPVAVFSMEMPAEQLGMRLIASLARVNQQRVRTGKLEDDDWPKITTAISILSEAPLFIDDTPALTPTEMRARARRLAREHGQLGLIVIDYLQLMQGSSGSDNRASEVSEISRSLKALAKELNVPVIALSQLNRSVEQRSDKRPMMSDLRESGSIEQDADVIIFIYRDEVYNEDSDAKGTAEIIVGKQRNGPIGTVRLAFVGALTKFENYTEEYHYDDGGGF